MEHIFNQEVEEMEEDFMEEYQEKEGTSDLDLDLDLEDEDMEVSNETKQFIRHYKREGKQIYLITASIYIDDLLEKPFHYLFGKPNVSSYDRYVKATATSNTKALKTFVLDNIIPEQRAELNAMLKKYPALAISLGEKLLAMLGFSKDVAVKKL